MCSCRRPGSSPSFGVWCEAFATPGTAISEGFFGVGAGAHPSLFTQSCRSLLFSAIQGTPCLWISSLTSTVVRSAEAGSKGGTGG
jgi:hypothetical protein